MRVHVRVGAYVCVCGGGGGYLENDMLSWALTFNKIFMLNDMEQSERTSREEVLSLYIREEKDR